MRTDWPRVIYLGDDALGVLATLTPKPGPVFLSRHGERYTPGGLRSILKRRGLSGAYALRHTFAQAAADADVPAEVLARLLGNSEAVAARHYYEVRDDRALRYAKTLRLPNTADRAG